MSSLRNAVARRPHRERAQPLERQRLGLLEKHKDYSSRAKDYNKKKTQLKNLRQKAAERNEDEFYFGMMSRKGPGAQIKVGKSWTGKAQGDRGNKSLSLDVVRLLKTQDVGYVRTMRQVARKEVAKLEEKVVLVAGFDRLGVVDNDDDDGDEEDDSEEDERMLPSKSRRSSQPRKIMFVDNEEDRERALAEHEASNHKDGGDAHDLEEDKGKQRAGPDREEALRKSKNKLSHARKKLEALTEAERQLNEQRAKMAKTGTSGGTTRRGKKLMIRARKR